jgi:hydroxymethylbilane synthase
MAGLRRLNAGATYTVPFAPDVLVPAVGQGALAVEVRREDEALAQKLHDAVNDNASQLCVSAERFVLRELRAGCNAPLGIHARIDGERVVIDAAFALLDRNEVLRERVVSSLEPDDVARAAAEIARLLRRVA